MKQHTYAWVIQDNGRYDNTVPIVRALNETGIKFYSGAVQHFTDQWITEPQLPHKNLIPYGTNALMRIARREEWCHLWYSDETFNTVEWTRHRTDMLNQDVLLMRADEIKDFVKSSHCSWFVRPSGDFKAFAGYVEDGTFNGHASDVFTLMPDLAVSVAPVQEILMEWRYFVVNRKIVTGSTYKYLKHAQFKRELDQEVLSEAQKVADGWLPHMNCVMDLAWTTQGLKIVEFNCLNCSGLYDHDTQALVLSVDQYMEEYS